ncbi:universal stress protein [Actinomycetospora chibensis]|uniref:Universal stress protein n=1 Tax=Actinomycetospora chibensis TaxID=663606 RepID=A0ABV9RNQ8_9PSEU|nr:universal stress protein [Actinomycetospora chibensis]MDD7923242.1 universal stress protein [Actinomycetospora chibensis]
MQVLPPSHHDHVLRAPQGRARALLEQGRQVAAAVAPDVPVRLSVVTGVCGPALVHVAERAELLVLGSRTAAGDLDLTVGRVVGHAIGHARCPVVLVPQIWDPAAAHSGNVLVHVDGTRESIGAVAFAADVADRWGAPLQPVAVGVRHGSRTDEQAARQRLANAVAGTPDQHPDLALHETVVWGNAAEAILHEARAQARLIVLCSRGYGALAASLLGATTQTVIRMASCPTAALPSGVAEVWATRGVGQVTADA